MNLLKKRKDNEEISLPNAETIMRNKGASALESIASGSKAESTPEEDAVSTKTGWREKLIVPMKAPKRKKTKGGNDEADEEGTSEVHEKLEPTVYGVRFPLEAIFFVAVGALSEVVDAMFMNATLMTLGTDLNPIVATIISYIVGAGCFFSMAFVGFQLANRRYYTKFGERISYAFWIMAGIALVVSKVLAGLVAGGLNKALTGKIPFSEVFATEEFISNTAIAVVQMVLYIGTGFMTRDSVKLLTDNDMREYFLAKRKYQQKLDQLADKRKIVTENISTLKSYPKLAKRLIKSRKSVMKNVAQYNQAARSLVESRMAMVVEPDLMEDIYDKAMDKEKRSVKEK